MICSNASGIPDFNNLQFKRYCYDAFKTLRLLLKPGMFPGLANAPRVRIPECIWEESPFDPTAGVRPSTALPLVCCRIMSAPFDLSVETLDAWCDKLLGCTPLTENEVMQLCNKVRARYAETR